MELSIIIYYYFNSTMVRLRVLKNYAGNYQQPYFNSTMVRLRDFLRSEILPVRSGFQFHYGSIKRLRAFPLENIDTNFNSTMVRLRVMLVE